MPSFLHYWNEKPILFIIWDRMFLKKFFPFFFVFYLKKLMREEEMERKSTMNVICFHRTIKLTWQMTKLPIIFSTILCLTKEILSKMWNFHIFMIILSILNNKKTLGKHFYFWRIESYPLKNDTNCQSLDWV
jgi:hypothetical protein